VLLLPLLLLLLLVQYAACSLAAALTIGPAAAGAILQLNTIRYLAGQNSACIPPNYRLKFILPVQIWCHSADQLADQ
jgi:hypothetical protein